MIYKISLLSDIFFIERNYAESQSESENVDSEDEYQLPDGYESDDSAYMQTEKRSKKQKTSKSDHIQKPVNDPSKNLFKFRLNDLYFIYI